MKLQNLYKNNTNSSATKISKNMIINRKLNKKITKQQNSYKTRIIN